MKGPALVPLIQMDKISQILSMNKIWIKIDEEKKNFNRKQKSKIYEYVYVPILYQQ